MSENNNKNWTLKALAKELDVSIATMSNAFKRPDQLSPKLRKHILDECLRLGYSGPSAAASSLRTGRTGVIGVLLSNYLAYSFSDDVAHQFLEGVAGVFEEHNLGMLVLSSRTHGEQIHGLESFVDGFVIYGPPKRHIRDRLSLQNKPIVTVDFTMEGYPSVNIDNYQSARNCANNVIRPDDKHIAILGIGLFQANCVCRLDPEIKLKPKSITVKRLKGFIDAARNKHIEVSNERIWHLPENTHKFGYQAAREALTCFPRPQLLLCMSDRIALSAVQAARHLGISVPDELRITGFDDITEANAHFPTLTTVHQKSYDKGKLAAQMLTGVKRKETIVLETELVIRESCPAAE